MLDIAWDGRRFRDSAGDPITTIFKLYPWEWMLAEPYGKVALEPGTPTNWLEPAWKLLLSNKALLAILWELFEGHELLLPGLSRRAAGADRIRGKAVARTRRRQCSNRHPRR